MLLWVLVRAEVSRQLEALAGELLQVRGGERGRGLRPAAAAVVVDNVLVVAVLTVSVPVDVIVIDDLILDIIIINDVRSTVAIIVVLNDNICFNLRLSVLLPSVRGVRVAVRLQRKQYN